MPWNIGTFRLVMFISCQNLKIFQFWLSICSFTRLQQIGMAPEAGRMSGNLLIQDRPSVPNMPTSQIAQLNPEVRNRNLLNTMFKVSLKEEMCFVMTRSNSVCLCLILTTFFSVQERRPSTTIYPRYNKSSKELLFISWGEHCIQFYDNITITSHF